MGSKEEGAGAGYLKKSTALRILSLRNALGPAQGGAGGGGGGRGPLVAVLPQDQLVVLEVPAPGAAAPA